MGYPRMPLQKIKTLQVHGSGNEGKVLVGVFGDTSTVGHDIGPVACPILLVGFTGSVVSKLYNNLE